MPQQKTVIKANVLIDSCFKPIFLKQYFKNKEFYSQFMRDVIHGMFFKVHYPLNLEKAKLLEFKFVNSTRKGIVIFLAVELSYLETEYQIQILKRFYPFLKSIKIIR